jgi:hypothetical protein
MHRLPAYLVIGTIGLAAAAGCGDRNAEQGAATGSPDLEQEAHGLEKAAETGAVAHTAEGVDEVAKQAAKDVEEQGVEATAKEVGKTLEENEERSAQAAEDTYREQRAAGEGAVQAGGDAYQAVLEEPGKKPKPKD